MIVKNEIFFDFIIEEINQGREVLINVKGNSMLPFLKDGQRIALSPIKSSNIKLGDVVLAKWNNKYILHRVVSKNSFQVSLAGDNNLSLVEKTGMENIIAKLKGTFNTNNKFNSYTTFDRILGLLWYLTRIPRIIINKIKL